MIQSDNTSQDNNTIKKDFRIKRTGPLDAYIYQNRDNNEDMKKTDTIFVHLFEEEKQTKPTLYKTHIFTDGACTNNGRKSANAAWGLIVVTDIGYEVIYKESGAIPKSEIQTNQRAELKGLLMGLRTAKKLYDLYPGQFTIWSDSQYSINCASVWGPKWKSMGWKKQGGPIQHFDLIRDLVEETIAMGHKIQYRWLKGHKGGESQHQFPWVFNHQVDALATSALE
jgi:ribonuclease HI